MPPIFAWILIAVLAFIAGFVTQLPKNERVAWTICIILTLFGIVTLFGIQLDAIGIVGVVLVVCMTLGMFLGGAVKRRSSAQHEESS